MTSVYNEYLIHLLFVPDDMGLFCMVTYILVDCADSLYACSKMFS